jgi:5,8-dihydroxy-2-naphthoate synthase
MNKQKIQLGHSPDPDDAFMFYGLACGAVDPGPFQFEHILRDIQTLNDWARRGKLEVTAVSVHAYAYLQDRYAILSSGASMGATDLADYIDEDGTVFRPEKSSSSNEDLPAQGPLLVAPKPYSLDEIKSKTIAIPGTMTSAFLALNLVLGKFDYTVIMFDEILPAVAQGRVDAGLIIHEGQLTYPQLGLHCILDLGHWWFEKNNLPLPLGCNIIRRDLGEPNMKQISDILRQSIQYGLDHREEAVKYALQFGRGLDLELADRFVGLYVNQWTINYGLAGRTAIEYFLAQGFRKGYIPKSENLDFI